MANQIKPPAQPVNSPPPVQSSPPPQSPTPPTFNQTPPQTSPQNMPPPGPAPQNINPPGPGPQASTTPSSSPPPEIKKSPFRIIVPIILGLLILAAVIFGVRYLFFDNGRDPNQPPEPITITYWGLWEPSSVIQSVLQQFELDNPEIKVEYKQQSHKDYKDRLQSSLINKTGPDVFRFHNTWLPMIDSLLNPLPAEVMSSSEYNQTFYPVASETLIRDRDILGIPLMYDGLSLYYNQDIFESAGLNPPETWPELRRIALQLTLKNENNILRGGIALGTTSNVEHWSDVLGLMMLQNGADPAMPNNEAGQGALTFYTLFSRTDKVWDDTMPNATLAFAQENVAMMIAPSWRAHDVADINPDLNFSTAPVPQLPDGNDVSWASFWAEGVSDNASKEKQLAAWKLLQYLSQKETLRKFYSAASDSPGRLFGEPFSRIDLADQLSSDPIVGSYITSAPNAQSWYLSSYTHDNALNDEIIKYYEDAINALNDTGESPDSVLEIVEEGVGKVLSTYGIR